MTSSRNAENSIQDLNVPISDQSEIPPESTVHPASPRNTDLDQSQIPSEDTIDSANSIEKPKTISPFNIQKLDQSKIQFYITSKQENSSVKKDLKSLTAVELVHEFILVYNETIKENKYQLNDKRYENDSCLQITYNCRTTGISRVDKIVLQEPKDINRSNLILFFFLKAADGTIENIYAATNYVAWKVVRPCADPNFPIKIIDRVSSPNKIVQIERRHLFGNFTEKKFKIDSFKEELYCTSSLLYFVENLVSYIDKDKERGAKLFNLLKIATKSVMDEPTSNNEHHSLSTESENEDSEELHTSAISSTSDNEKGYEQSTEITHVNSECHSPPRKKKKDEIFVKYKKYKTSFRIKITTAGSISILNHIPKNIFLTTIIEIIMLLNMPLSDDKPKGEKFDFLFFFKASPVLKSKLDDALIENIFKRIQVGEKPHVDVQHTCYNDYFLSDKYEIRVVGEKNFKNIGSEAPDIDTIVKEVDATNLETFKEIMKNGQLRFYKRVGNDPVITRIIDCLEAEVFHKGKHYFKFRKTWYQMKADYLSLLQQDFEQVMDKLFIQKGEEGSLPKIWYKSEHVTQDNIKAILEYGKGIQKFMTKLRETHVCYVSEDKVMQNKLIGEILETNVIKQYKDEIENALTKFTHACSEKAFKGLFQKELKKNISKDTLDLIWKELTKQRKIIDEKNVAANPFPYPLKGDLNEKFKSEGDKKYTMLKEYLYELCGPHQSEEDYNRSYVIDSSSNIDSGDNEYIVFDQILSDGIESCDILRHKKNKLYLYHVKEVLGYRTREVCSQIMNAATNIHEALRTNQKDNYLKNLWNVATKETQEGWRKVSKSRLEKIGEKKFMDMFRERDIVFIYAYRTPSGFKNSHALENLSDLMNDTCKKLGFINEYGYLTSDFFHTTKDDFENMILSEDASFKKTDCKAAYSILQNREFSNSTIAKMEVIRLAQQLINFCNRFDFKICEIPIE